MQSRFLMGTVCT